MVGLFLEPKPTDKPCLQLETLDSLEAVDALGQEWHSVFERDAASTPFQSPDWLLTWWRTWGFGKALLRVLSIRYEERLVGIAPLFVHRWPDQPIRRISWIGSGISDHLDLISDPGFALASASELMNYLVEHQADWDIADLQELRSDSHLLFINDRSELRKKIFPSEPCPVCSLPGCIDALRAGLNRRHRRSLSQGLRKMQALGDLRLKVASEEDLPFRLEDLFRLHQASWERKGLPGVLADPVLFGFHLRSAAALQKKGHLRLYSLDLNGKAVASLYAMVKGSRIYCYLSGFDPEMERFSPGALLLSLVMEDSLYHGFRECDFLR